MPAVRTDSQIYLGLGLHDRPEYISLLEDAPHVACSMTTGMGKSTLCRVVGSQILHHGGRVVIMDSVKAGDSHGGWCRDENGELLPGVELYRTHDEVHEALIAWAKERHRRSDAAYRRTGEHFQRTLVILEEMNATIGALRNYWAQIKRTGDPVRSPAVDAILDLTCAGRSACIHVLAVAQKLTAAAAGSDAVRENLAIKILGNCSERTWKMLVPDVKYPKRGMSTDPGFVVLVHGRRIVELHIHPLSDEDAREWATNGAPQPVDAGLRLPTRDLPVTAQATTAEASGGSVPPPTSPRTYSSQNEEGDDATEGQDPERIDAFDMPPDLITLRQALDLGLLPDMTWETARKARQRDDKNGKFPASRGADKQGAQLYDWQDLLSWHANRKGAAS
jgi:hypothetical protein